ncbi:MAG: UDP-N-acetylmuramoyl-tripeptide--D-alanyl-D-alanine ligase [Halioglobus sp.]|nr:UDP-N-acetylmuramoyl-tripeptide--D-alanyl-D-alanine ligase [Halioglobus sp.]
MMRPLTLSELTGPLEATLLGDDVSVGGVSTDSRSVAPGDLFVALRGERFDGHDYLDVAREAGAAAALVSDRFDATLPQLQVIDTRRALGLLGAYNRSLYAGVLVAITGSSGKTTVKGMVQAVLSRAGHALATEGNFNNEIGVPLTLLRLSPQVEYAVVEMGAARRGDIAWLCRLGRPGVALLLNAMPAHLEGFGSLEDVAAAKGEIFDGLGADDCAVINADQPWAGQWRKRAGEARIIDFALDSAAAISATAINLQGVDGVSFTASTPEGDIAIRLSLAGRHNVANALAAIAVGMACGLSLTDIRDGLESLQPVAGRLCTQRTLAGFTLIDDCYNANPGSVRAAIDTLASCAGRRTLILGAMLELGEDSEQLHRDIGRYASDAGIDAFWGVGPELRPAVAEFGEAGRFFADRDEALAALAGAFAQYETVLVKGSRGAGMELLCSALRQQSPGRTETC